MKVFDSLRNKLAGPGTATLLGLVALQLPFGFFGYVIDS
jgi:hypothetical protein